MSKGRYLVILPTPARENNIIAGLYASGYAKAEIAARELFGPTARVKQYVLRAGWKDNGGLYLTKETKYGVRYICKACGHENLGIGGGRNHRGTCNYHPAVLKTL
jgi:hypothetical protein